MSAPLSEGKSTLPQDDLDGRTLQLLAESWIQASVPSHSDFVMILKACRKDFLQLDADFMKKVSRTPNHESARDTLSELFESHWHWCDRVGAWLHPKISISLAHRMAKEPEFGRAIYRMIRQLSGLLQFASGVSHGTMQFSTLDRSDKCKALDILLGLPDFAAWDDPEVQEHIRQDQDMPRKEQLDEILFLISCLLEQMHMMIDVHPTTASHLPYLSRRKTIKAEYFEPTWLYLLRSFPRLENQAALSERLVDSILCRHAAFEHFRHKPASSIFEQKITKSVWRLTELRYILIDVNTQEVSPAELQAMPPLPRVKDGFEIRCPYCGTRFGRQESFSHWHRQILDDQRLWHQHVMDDIRPYTCTFQPCSQRNFPSRASWLSHEIRCHNLLRRLEFSACPFCDELQPSPTEKFNAQKRLKHYCDHVGDHLQTIALTTLPYSMDEAYEAELDEITLAAYSESPSDAPMRVRKDPLSCAHTADVMNDSLDWYGEEACDLAFILSRHIEFVFLGISPELPSLPPTPILSQTEKEERSPVIRVPRPKDRHRSIREVRDSTTFDVGKVTDRLSGLGISPSLYEDAPSSEIERVGIDL